MNERQKNNKKDSASEMTSDVARKLRTRRSCRAAAIQASNASTASTACTEAMPHQSGSPDKLTHQRSLHCARARVVTEASI